MTNELDNSVDEIKASLELASEPIRRAAIEGAEKRIEAQTTLMLAADARAISMISVGVSLSALSLAAVIASFENNLPNVGYSIICGGVFALLGAYWCYLSAKPVDIHPIGWAPMDFKSDIGLSQAMFQASTAAYLGMRIELNTRTMERNSSKFRVGVRFILISPLAVGLAALALAICSRS